MKRLNGYFDWAGDLYVPCMLRFRKKCARGARLQDYYSCDPLGNWERAWRICERSRLMVSRLIHAMETDRVVLTQGTTEGFIRVMDSLVRDRNTPFSVGDTIVTTDGEFPPFYQQLCCDFDVAVAHVANCRSQQEIREAILTTIANSARPIRFVFLSHVFYRTGTHLPLEMIVPQVRRICPDAIILVDGAQAVGQVTVDVTTVGADYYIGDFHKWVQGPNFTGFVWCRDDVAVERLARYATHPMAFARSFGVEGLLCSKFGPLPAPLAGLPAALKGFLSGDYVLGSFKLATYLRQRIMTEWASDNKACLLAPEKLGTGIVSLVLGQNQRGLRQRLFDKHGLLVSEQWPQIPVTVKKQIACPGFVRISCSDQWNTREEVDHLYEALCQEWSYEPINEAFGHEE